jgi:hypothetical protein
MDVDGSRLEPAGDRVAQEALLQHFENAGLEPHDAADSEFAQQCWDMRAGFDAPTGGGDDELSTHASVAGSAQTRPRAL